MIVSPLFFQAVFLDVFALPIPHAAQTGFNTMSSIIGILLAAGTGRRFGGDKLSQALPEGECVAVRACRNLAAEVDRVVAVVRPDCEVLAARLQAEGAEVAVCMDAEQGMGVSLAFAISLCPKADGWVIALADMPWIAPASIRAVADSLRAGAMIAAPSWQGQRGHPVGFSQGLAAELLALSGDAGAKAVIQRHHQQLSLLACDDPGILRDIDKPEDLCPPTLAAKAS